MNEWMNESILWKKSFPTAVSVHQITRELMEIKWKMKRNDKVRVE